MTTKVQKPKNTAAKKARKAQMSGAKRAETTAQYSGPERLADHAWKPGQSGNPAGRPKGTKHKIQEAFLEDVLAEWQESGKTAIKEASEKNPLGFCQMVAGLLPKEAKLEMDASDAFINLWRMVASGELKREILGLEAADDESLEMATH